MAFDGPQSAADARLASPPAFAGAGSIHPAEAFTPAGRSVFAADIRQLPASIIRGASFALRPGPHVREGRLRIEDRRPAEAQTVAGCEGASCAVKAADNG